VFLCRTWGVYLFFWLYFWENRGSRFGGAALLCTVSMGVFYHSLSENARRLSKNPAADCAQN
jgi:hypothetical protein